MPPIPANIVRFTLTWKPNTDDWPGELAVNTFHMKFTPSTPPGPGWDTSLQEGADMVAAALVSKWGTGMSGIHGAGYQIAEVGAFALDTNGKATNEAVHTFTSGTLVGSGTGGIMPPEVALAIGWFGYQPGAFTSRRGTKRGRMYLPYISSVAASAAGKVQSSFITDASTGWKAWHDVIHAATTASGEWDFGILSETANAFTTASWLVIDNHFDSQRRRQHQSPAVQTVTALG